MIDNLYELPANSPRPAETPAEGVIVTDISPDGWTRKYVYKSHMGSAEETLLSETAPDRRAKKAEMIPTAGRIPMGLGHNPQPRFGAPGLGLGQSRSFGSPRHMVPMLGQAPPEAPAPAPPPLPPACPGPLQMPDGRVINPEDSLSLENLCEILPFLLEAEGKKGGGGRGGLFGQPSMGASAGFGGFGGGGAGPAGAPGTPGTAGLQGPPGPGTATDFLVKTDGDFTAGPGAFVTVPGTLLAFNTPADGAAIFLLQAVLGCSNSQNAVIGLRIDGADFPLNVRLIHTFPAGVEEFFIPVHASFPMNLTAGAHTVEVLLRGISAGEFCSASGLGFPATVSANTGTPLALTVLHQGPAAISPSAPVLTIDGINKVDGNFTSASVVPVPGTSVSFMVTAPGNAYFAISGTLDAVGVVEITNAILGIRIDSVDYSLAQTSEQQGAGDDHFNVMHLAGSLTLQMGVGPHTAQLLFGNVGGVNQFALHASVDHPATISVIHP